MADTSLPGNDPVAEGRKLIVLGLPYSTTEESMKMHMSQFGNVEDCYIMKDKASGRSRGFGFVVFTASHEAQACLASPDQELDGRRIEPQLAAQRKQGEGGESKSSRIFVGKLPPTVDTDSVRAYFSTFGEVSDCYLPRNPAGGHKGYGFISFTHSNAVDLVQAQPVHELGGTQVVIDRADPKKEGSAGGAAAAAAPGMYGGMYGMPGFGGMPGYGAMPGFGGMPGMAPGYGAAAASASAADRKLFIGRVAYTSTEDTVRSFFSQFGLVEDVYLARDANGDPSRNRGFGFVSFVDPAVASRVLSMRELELDGRKIVVGPASKKGTGPITSGKPEGGYAGSPGGPAAAGGYGAAPAGAYGGNPYGASAYGAGAYGAPGVNPAAMGAYGAYAAANPYAAYGAYGAGNPYAAYGANPAAYFGAGAQPGGAGGAGGPAVSGAGAMGTAQASSAQAPMSMPGMPGAQFGAYGFGAPGGAAGAPGMGGAPGGAGMVAQQWPSAGQQWGTPGM